MPPETTRTLEINALFYNTHLFGGKLKIADFFAKLHYKEKLRADKIAAELKKFSSTDSGISIVGLCELWDDKYAEDMYDKLDNMFHECYNPHKLPQPGNELDSGLLLFANEQFIKEQFNAYWAEKGFDSRSQKGLIRAVLELPSGQRVVIFITHLQSGQNDDEVKARAHQLEQLNQAIISTREFEFIGSPIIIMGDFNIIAEDDKGNKTAEYRQMLNKLKVKDAYRVKHKSAKTSPGFTADSVNNTLIKVFNKDSTHMQRLDYMLYDGLDGQLEPVECEIEKFETDQPINSDHADVGFFVKHLSDHYGVRARFKLTISS